VFDLIVHLNDYRQWTREAIADWVETAERGLPQPVAGTAVKDAETVTV
jgi:hypothetical protein